MPSIFINNLDVYIGLPNKLQQTMTRLSYTVPNNFCKCFTFQSLIQALNFSGAVHIGTVQVFLVRCHSPARTYSKRPKNVSYSTRLSGNEGHALQCFVYEDR